MAKKRDNQSRKRRSVKQKAGTLPKFLRNVVPDSIDLRDRPYIPSIKIIPAEVFAPKVAIPVLNQRETSACTGFALASVIYHLQLAAQRKPADYAVSPFMLYSMARRYDEFPGSPTADTGSSLRGAMKGWYKHGACAANLWPSLNMPKPVATNKKASTDWWLDAVRRPLGAYYRVDVRSVTDMQIALNEIGVLYASAVAHAGWDEGSDRSDLKAKANHEIWIIPHRKALASDGAHAFAIVGYTRDGFILHNSWDTNWGSRGSAILTYDDWIENAMDCWVAQLGVMTDVHSEIASSKSLRVESGKVHLASDQTLRNREITPFIIDMANNGLLSNTGDFRTQESDVVALVNQQVAIARSTWGLKDDDAMDVAIYAHGGLVSEDAAAETAAKWIPALYEAKIFPVFLMWETGLLETLRDQTGDLLAKQARTTGGVLDKVRTWWNARLEKLLTVPGTALWGEMKKNADCISGHPESGGLKLYKACEASPYFGGSKVRLHLIGHSAGAIVHSLIVDRLGKAGWRFETVNFMAPAVRADSFIAHVVPAIQSGRVKAYNQFSLLDEIEQKDRTCEPILGYSRSLLYLVSQSFEHGVVTPILGMQKYFVSQVLPLHLPNVTLTTAPSELSKSTTHGGFDDDPTTMGEVISLIKASSAA